MNYLNNISGIVSICGKDWCINPPTDRNDPTDEKKIEKINISGVVSICGKD
jgi:hypothetical protein